MRLNAARIKKFKRFADLTIQNLPPEAKLIVLLGPNGCGKSSLFDAFQRRLKVDHFFGMSDEMRKYYQRKSFESSTESEDEVHLEFHGPDPTSEADLKKSLYIRSAYRHEPSFQNTAIEQQPDVLDRHAVIRLIDTDRTVQSNYQRIIWRLLGMVTTPGLTTDSIISDTIGDLQKSMATVFGDISLDAVVGAQDTGTFTFTKGKARNFLYENLSAGEKAAFDLLLDIVVNKAAFDNTLYCIDEPEIHLNTRLQGVLLKELYCLVPENSQLWLATHSIGMVRTAQEIQADNPNHVAFLDLGFQSDGQPRDYDEPQTVEPVLTDHRFWSRHYGVALDDMAQLLAPDRIVLCEGSSDSDDPALDEACYNTIFAREFPSARFISVGSATQVEKRMGDLLPVLRQIVSSTAIIRFRDRDRLTPEEISRKRDEGIRCMSEYRNIESMLLSDAVLQKLCDRHDKSDRFIQIKAARDRALNQHGTDHPPDDLKPAAQAVHHSAISELALSRPGETRQSFMRDVLTPLVTHDMLEYQRLKDDIFGQ